MAAYSFLDVHVSLTGPGGSFSLGSGAGAAEEGISVEFSEDATRQVVGADGTAMQSLNPSKAGKVLVRLLKTSPVNYNLAQLYNFQRLSSLTWGQNLIVVTNPVTGDDYTCQNCAFTKFPRNDFPKDPTRLEWDFTCGVIDPVLGAGISTLSALVS